MLNWQASPAQFSLLDNHVDVWKIDLSQHVSYVDAYAKFLNAEETERAQRFYFLKDRQYFTITRACLRLLLGKYLNQAPADIHFTLNQYGKPFVAEQALHFNVTHSQDIALIAFNLNQALGVDIEKITREVEYLDLAQRFFAEEEIQQLTSVPVTQQAQVFFNIWTRKEAFIKAIGQGLSFPLTKFAVTGLLDRPPALIRVDDNEFAKLSWMFTSFVPATDYLAALGVAQKIKQINYWQFSDSLIS